MPGELPRDTSITAASHVKLKRDRSAGATRRGRGVSAGCHALLASLSRDAVPQGELRCCPRGLPACRHPAPPGPLRPGLHLLGSHGQVTGAVAPPL